MGKYLNSSANTGTKISSNMESFTYSYEKNEPNEDGSILYRFTWKFNEQHGYASITVKDNEISNSSLIDTDSQSPHPFDRPLGLYNDPSLKSIFTDMMNSVDIDITGVYAKNF